MDITVKQKKLVDTLLLGATSEASYVAAGYKTGRMSTKSITNEVDKILNKLHVAEYKKQQQDKLQQETDITAKAKRDTLWEIAQEGTKT